MFRFAPLIVGAAATGSCSDNKTPDLCIGKSENNAIDSCSWDVLQGRCMVDGAVETPADCCISTVPGSRCSHQNPKLADGACTVPIVESGATFSLTHAKRMLHYAGAAYCTGSQVNAWSCGEHCNNVDGLTMITHIEHTSTVLAGFVAYDTTSNAIVVAFRGTVSSSIIDWINNLDYVKVTPWSKYPNAGVHRGFNSAWNDLKSDVMKAVNSIRSVHSTSTVHVTGHSLGASIAVNAAMDMKISYGLSTSTVDFGRPRTGDSGFASALASEGITTFRVTHHKDLVPHAPLEVMGFYHSPTEVYYADDSSSNYKICNGSGEDNSCSDGVLLPDSVADHLFYMGYTMGGDNCAASVVV
jgi:hypothetical protein